MLVPTYPNEEGARIYQIKKFKDSTFFAWTINYTLEEGILLLSHWDKNTYTSSLGIRMSILVIQIFAENKNLKP